jgi:hypothetical protein
MSQDLPQTPEPSAELVPLNLIRTETALSRFPVHRIAKRGNVKIELKNQATAVLWKVSYNSEYGQPGPLAYKLDTIVINRKIEEAGKPVPKLLRLGSLSDVCRELGLADGGKQRTDIRNALLQDASAFITAKITYKRSDKSERFLEAGFTRYSVIFTGESLPDGGKADAVYLLLNELYQEVLNEAQTRPLDYEYMKTLPPAAQRFYEVVSYQVYGALLNKNPRAKLTYSDYCTLSTQTRYTDWNHVKKQMYKVHLPHLQSGYLAKVEYETTSDPEGRPDWTMLYTPGPNAAAEFRAFKGGGNRAVQRLPKKPVEQPGQEQLHLPTPGIAPEPAPKKSAPEPTPEPLSPETAALVAELRSQGIGGKVALSLAQERPDECRLYIGEYLPFWEAEVAAGEFDYKKGKGAFLTDAIRNAYGPPKSYEVAKRAEAIQKQKEGAAKAVEARQGLQEARRGAFVAEGVSWIGRMENEAPEAFLAFTAYVERELQTALGRFKAPRAQESYRQLYAGDKKRVELFARYFAQNPCPLPELAHWLGEHAAALKQLTTSDR